MFSKTKAGQKKYSKKNQELDALAEMLGLTVGKVSRGMIFKTMEFQCRGAENYAGKGGEFVADVLKAAQHAKLTSWEQFTPFLQRGCK